MAQGTVKWFDAEKGFGFITVDGGDADVFVHFSAIARSGYQTLTENQRVEVELSHGARGVEAGRIRVLASGGSVPDGPGEPVGEDPAGEPVTRFASGSTCRSTRTTSRRYARPSRRRIGRAWC